MTVHVITFYSGILHLSQTNSSLGSTYIVTCINHDHLLCVFVLEITLLNQSNLVHRLLRLDILLAQIFLAQVRLRTDVLHTPSSTQLGFELMSSRWWQYNSYVNERPALNSAIIDFSTCTISFPSPPPSSLSLSLSPPPSPPDTHFYHSIICQTIYEFYKNCRS